MLRRKPGGRLMSGKSKIFRLLLPVVIGIVLVFTVVMVHAESADKTYDIGDVEVKGSDRTALGVGNRDSLIYSATRELNDLQLSDDKTSFSVLSTERGKGAAEEAIEPRENWFSIYYGSNDLLGYELFDTFRVGSLQDAIFLFGGGREKSDGHRLNAGFSASEMKLDSGVNLAGDSNLEVRWNIKRKKNELPGPVSSPTPRARLDDTNIMLDLEFEHLEKDASRWGVDLLFGAHKREVAVPDILQTVYEKYTDDIITLGFEYVPSIDSKGFLSFAYSYMHDEIKRHPLDGSAVTAGRKEASNHTISIQREILPGPETLLVLAARLDSHSLVGDKVSTSMAVTHHMDPGWKLALNIGREFDPSSFHQQFFAMNYVAFDPAGQYKTPQTGYVGLKSEHFLDDSTQAALSLRRETVDSYPVYDDDLTTGKFSLVYREATVWKAEASVKLALSEVLVGKAGYTFISTEDQFGKDLPFAPMNEWLVTLTYRYNDYINIGLDERLVGKRFSGPNNIHRLDRYILLGLDVNVAISEVLNAYLRVDNIFDKGYQLRRNYPEPGREIKVGMKVRF